LKALTASLFHKPVQLVQQPTMVKYAREPDNATKACKVCGIHHVATADDDMQSLDANLIAKLCGLVPGPWVRPASAL
jgi:hypothetical protein